MAIFHAAAVSDFGLGLVYERGEGNQLRAIYSSKLSTRAGNLLVELRPTPKILPQLREWFPGAQIFGWKYEVEGDRSAALDAGLRQIQSAQVDACVVNGPAHGTGYTLVRRTGELVSSNSIQSLCQLLCRSIAGEWDAH